MIINYPSFIPTALECNMCYDSQPTAQPRDKALDYIKDRIRDLMWTKQREIENKYEDPSPKNIKEAKEWLKEGNYRFDIPEGYTDEYQGHWRAFFAWGKEPKDYEAERKELAALDEARQNLKDKITILTDENARLTALEEFKAYPRGLDS